MTPKPETQGAKRLYVFDGHSLCYQAYHAISLLTSPDGTPVNAVYGFLNMILKVLKGRKPEHVAVVFDSHGPTFREGIRADYKAQRAPMPDDLRPQIQLSIDAAKALGIPVYAKPGFEADDLLAAIAAKAAKEGIETVLVTNDKDAKQLLSEQVRIYDARKERIYSEADLKADTGLTAAQMVDYQCLVGDAVDNVKGAEGVGPKTAQKLLGEHGTLEGIYENLDRIKQEKLRERLKEARERVFENRALLRLRDDVPVDLTLSDLRPEGPYPPEAAELFRKLGFMRLLATATKPEPRKPKPEAGPRDPEPESRAPSPEPRTPTSKISHPASRTPHPVQARVVPDAAGIEALAKRLAGADAVALETATAGEETLEARLLGIAFSTAPGSADYLPLGEDPAKALAPLRAVLEDARKPKIGRRLQRDRTVLAARTGIALSGLSFDVSIAAYLLDSSRRDRSLSTLAADHLGESLPEPAPEEADSLLPPPPEALAEALGRAAEACLRLSEKLGEALDREGLVDLFRTIEMPVASILSDMEREGIRIDAKALLSLAEEAGAEMSRLERKAHEAAGKMFNVASSQQLAEVLFGDLGLPKHRRTKTGWSTDSDVLEELADKHPLPPLILEWRQLAKLKSTYLEALPQKVNPRTGRLHASFHQTVAATGRLSSSDPNLQNIPVRTPLGRRIRAAFLPSDGRHVLISADYSQIELRVLAHLCGDAGLRKAFDAGRDVHVQVAALLYGIPEKEVTEEMRAAAKVVDYSIIYGKTPFTLSRDLRIPVQDAAKLVDAFFAAFPGIVDFREKAVEEARSTGRVRTLSGRYRPVPEAASKLRNVREGGERAAINAIVQGSAADLMKKAMIDAENALRKEAPGTKILLQIHDELLLDAPKGEADAAMRATGQAMEQAMKLSVPLEVHLGQGNNWLEAAG